MRATKIDKILAIITWLKGIISDLVPMGDFTGVPPPLYRLRK
jgi:hypothetical protein